MSDIVGAAEQFVRERLGGDAGGHDWWHVDRVRRMALKLAEHEGADRRICEMAALLHDLADDKLVTDEREALRDIRGWLVRRGEPEASADHIVDIIATMSFRGGEDRPPMRTLEGRVVQDADRLDALGAVGIARTFAYSGKKGRPMHDPALRPRESMTAEQYRSGNDTAINHFYEKLLKLKAGMNTEYGRVLAERRHAYTESFLRQFAGEWEGEL